MELIKIKEIQLLVVRVAGGREWKEIAFWCYPIAKQLKPAPEYCLYLSWPHPLFLYRQQGERVKGKVTSVFRETCGHRLGSATTLFMVVLITLGSNKYK